MSLKKKIIFIFLILLLIGAGFTAGFFVGKFQVVCPTCQPSEVDFSLFWEAWHKLQEKFVDKEKFDVQKAIYGAISGMVKSLGDPYTTFLNPEDTKRLLKMSKGLLREWVWKLELERGNFR